MDRFLSSNQTLQSHGVVEVRLTRQFSPAAAACASVLKKSVLFAQVGEPELSAVQCARLGPAGECSLQRVVTNPPVNY